MLTYRTMQQVTCVTKNLGIFGHLFFDGFNTHFEVLSLSIIELRHTWHLVEPPDMNSKSEYVCHDNE